MQKGLCVAHYYNSCDMYKSVDQGHAVLLSSQPALSDKYKPYTVAVHTDV